MHICWIKLEGWPTHFDERLEATAKHVDQITVIRAKQDDNLGRRAPANVTIINIPPARTPILESNSQYIWYPVWTAFSIIYLFYWRISGRGIDVVHSIDPSLAGLVGFLYSGVTGTSFVVSVRGLHTVNSYLRNRNKRNILGYLLYSVNKFVLPHADLIQVKDPDQRQIMKSEFGVTEEKILVLPTGVPQERFNPENIPDRDHLKHNFALETDGKNKILFLGRISASKGIIELLSHVSKLGENYYCTIIGEFESPGFKEEVNEIISEKNLETKVSIIDKWIGQDIVPSIIYDADVLCLLSKSGVEGAPRIIQESLAMRTPVIASDVNGIRGTFSSIDGVYLIDPIEYQQFKLALDSAMGKDVPDEYTNIFDLESNYQKLSEAYREIHR